VELSVAEIELKDGRVLTAQTDERELDLDLDRRRERATRKFFNLTGSRLDRDAIVHFQARLLDLESIGSISSL
jgi:hypothetical protein